MTAAKTADRKPTLAQRESEEHAIEFGAAKSMDYKHRLTIVMALVLIGFGLQVALLNAWVGVPFLLFALVLTWVRGFDAKLDHRRPRMNGAWEETDVGRIKDILDLDKKMRSWDSSLMDISSPGGAFMFLLALGGVAAVWFMLREDTPNIATIVAVDGVLLIVPQWFNGMRFIQTRGDLVLKATHVAKVLDRVGTKDVGDADLKARMYMVGKDGERNPNNFKLTARWPDGPEGFYGLQAQVVVNRVQGTGYPYFYACLVAKEGLGLLERGVPKGLPPGVIVETETKDEVDVVIIRQKTSKTSGYHTKPPKSSMILRTALRAGERFAAG
ncbi:MAG: hypothetical protein QNJ98_06185 [Planctomycetota bacterium]|nr:hypothetical protein [Planctomycetota bacterium]